MKKRHVCWEAAGSLRSALPVSGLPIDRISPSFASCLGDAAATDSLIWFLSSGEEDTATAPTCVHQAEERERERNVAETAEPLV